MTTADIQHMAPEQARVFEDGELVAEIFRGDHAFEDRAPFHLVDLTDDPHGPRSIYAGDRSIETARWTIDPRSVR